MQRFTILFIIFVLGVFSPLGAEKTYAADTEPLTNVLKKIDQVICNTPDKITPFYSKKLVMMLDDRRSALDARIKDYKRMISEYQGIQCVFNRQVLAAELSDTVGYMLADETVSIKSKISATDERQHHYCTYIFVKESKEWKISHEHCSSLPDYTIAPGDDALYYFHNPIY